MPAWYLLQVIVTHSPATVAHQEVHGNIPPPNCQKSRNRWLIPPNSGKFNNKFSHWRVLLYNCPAFIHWLSIIHAGHHRPQKWKTILNFNAFIFLYDLTCVNCYNLSCTEKNNKWKKDITCNTSKEIQLHSLTLDGVVPIIDETILLRQQCSMNSWTFLYPGR